MIDKFPNIKTIIESSIERCVSCGTCKTSCPIFTELGDEAGSMRGKIALIGEVWNGGLRATNIYKGILEKCTLCMGCLESCPNGVKTEILVIIGRALFKETKRLNILGFLLNKYLNNPGFMLWSVSMLRFLQGSVFSNLYKFLLRHILKRDFIPQISNVFLRDLFPERIETDKRKLRVVYFPGCLIDFLFPEIGISTISLLNAIGVEVLYPKSFKCCGIPLLGIGEIEGAYSLAKYNSEIFSNIKSDYIVTSCGSCGATLKRSIPELYGNSRNNFEMDARKVRDVVEVINEIGIEQIVSKNYKIERDLKVVYHNSCHLKAGMGVGEQYINLLKFFHGIKLFNFIGENACCGFGGSFNIKYYELSNRINQRRVEEIKNINPDVLLTGSPGCIMNFMDGFIKNNIKIEVLHPLVILSRFLKYEPV